ncbi:Cys-tRNA(Pro) deacylase [Intestinimonas sp.]|uniref:Cys-tRNA(Pro) deacylase n=1 Tax=Intestinimonas sp. TaxID=1965293 RepID=UPI002638D10D|nr:Cys-tRNA(Pro) deacylase [Intestinimonas sp.]
MAEEKTNVMRILDQKKIPYTPHSYPHGAGEAVDGATVAALIGRDPGEVFKTLVTRGASKANYVFVVPVLAELDLKKAARTVGEKSIELIHVKELTPLTGYVRGGCSPIGMKKRLKTVVDASARDRAAILVSAGKIGAQVELSPDALAGLIGGSFADVVKAHE